MLVATKLSLRQTSFCHNKRFVMASLLYMFVATKDVATKACLLRRKFCRDKYLFVATNMFVMTTFFAATTMILSLVMASIFLS